nr:cell wall hydrolase [Burkholderia sp. HAN2018]
MTNRTIRRLRPFVRAAARVLACTALLGAPPALHAADTA